MREKVLILLMSRAMSDFFSPKLTDILNLNQVVLRLQFPYLKNGDNSTYISILLEESGEIINAECSNNNDN